MRISHKAGGAMAIHAKVENQLVFNGDGTLSSATKPDLKNAPAETLATIGVVREMNRMPLFFQGIHDGDRASLVRVFNGSATPNDGLQISALTHPEVVKGVLRGDVANVSESEWQSDPYKRGAWSRGTAYLDGEGKPQGWVRTPDLNQAMPDSLPPPFARGGADAKAGSIGKDTMRNIKGRFNPLVYGTTSHTGPDGAIRTLVAGRNNVSGATGQGIGQEDMEFDASKALPEGHTGTEFAPWHVYGVSYSITSNGVFNEGAIDAEQVGAEVLQLKNDLMATGMVVFDTPGVQTWQVPEILRSGKKKARVLVVGGGGGGIVSAAGGGANGGAGGGWAEGLVDLSGVVSIPITVAVGGASRTDAANVGSAGGSSSFGDYLSATGGSGARKVSDFAALSLGGGGTGAFSSEVVGGVKGKGFVGLPSAVAGLGGASYFGGQTEGVYAAPDNTVSGAGGASGSTRGAKGGDGLVSIYW